MSEAQLPSKRPCYCEWDTKDYDYKCYEHSFEEGIVELLVGRSVFRVSEDTLELDDGRLLRFLGNSGGCSCGSGDYPLTELNGVDNIITKVEFVDSPGVDHPTDKGEGHYKIFVYADNKKINLATFEGHDGNGYYGTGYSIHVRTPEVHVVRKSV